MVVGDCAGGEGDSITGFADGWDGELAAEVAPIWVTRNYMAGNLMDVDRLVGMVHAVLRDGATLSIPSIIVAPRHMA